MPQTFDPPPPTSLPEAERTRLHGQLSYASRIRGGALVSFGLVLLLLGLVTGPLLGYLTQQESAILLILTVFHLGLGLALHGYGNRQIRSLLAAPLTRGRGRVSQVRKSTRRWGCTKVSLVLTLPDGTQRNGHLHHYGPLRALETGDTLALYFTEPPSAFFPSQLDLPCDLGQYSPSPTTTTGT